MVHDAQNVGTAQDVGTTIRGPGRTTMKMLELVNSAAVPNEAAIAGELTPATVAPPATSVDEQAFDGRQWTFRNGFERTLRRLPGSAWGDPAAQGWQCVKRNSSRSVWRAEVADRTYFLKYYESNGWLDRAKSLLRRPACIDEWQSGLFALNAGISVVQPAGFTIDRGPDGNAASILVTEAVEPAWPLNEFWRILTTDQDAARQRGDRDQLIDRLAELIARAHQAGFEHVDMHAENILVQRQGQQTYRAVFVDVHSARRDVPITEKAVVRNLAQLNQWFRRHAALAERLRFLKAYLRWRNEFEHAYPHARRLVLDYADLVHSCADAADRHATRLWAARDRRIGRPGRYFARVRLNDGWRASVFKRTKRVDPTSPSSRLDLSRDWWRRTLNDFLRLRDVETETSVKDSHSAIVSRAEWVAPDSTRVPVMIKQPQPRNGLRQLRMLMPPSRSRRAWQVANALLNRNIPTPRPLAILEQKTGPLVRQSILVTEFLDHARDLEAWLKHEQAQSTTRASFRRRRALLSDLVRRLRQLHERGFVHRDCKASNILVAEDDAGQLTLLWTDMDGIRHTGRVGQRHVDRAMMRLFVSLNENGLASRSDAVRFLQEYAARFGADPADWRTTWRRIAPSVATKQAKLLKRRAWKQTKYGRD